MNKLPFSKRTPSASASASASVSANIVSPLASASTSSNTEAIIASSSWEDLEGTLSTLQAEHGYSDDREPVLTLYRDTNGWCPFCERVWIVIRAKNLPYRERLISLFAKPEWYKEIVPTTQVPAVLFHDPASADEPNARKIVWESKDIMKALDDQFPSTPRMVLDTPEYQAATEKIGKLATAGFGFSNTKNTTLVEQEERKVLFLEALDELEDDLVARGGPFRLGKDFSGVDAEMAPLLEKWRWQFPVSKEFDITEGRPGIQKWFDAMDGFAPYSERVMGDQYSWVATASMFARFFGDAADPKVLATIERSDAEAKRLMENLSSSSSSPSNIDDKCEAKFAFEAAAKVISNHEAIASDCSNKDPKSQVHISRSGSEVIADVLLSYIASLLMNEGDKAIKFVQSEHLQLPAIEDGDKSDMAQAARTVASRLCVPRDMSAPAAKVLRTVLLAVAEKLD